MLREEAITASEFHRRNVEWVKTTSIKNRDLLVAPEDDKTFDNVYSTNQLLDFRLRPRS